MRTILRCDADTAKVEAGAHARHTPRSEHELLRQRWFGAEEAVEKRRRMHAADRARKAKAILSQGIVRGTVVASRGRPVGANGFSEASVDALGDRAFAVEEARFYERTAGAHVEVAEPTNHAKAEARTAGARTLEHIVGADSQASTGTNARKLDRKRGAPSRYARSRARPSPTRATKRTLSAPGRSFVSTAHVVHSGGQRGLRGSFFGSAEAVERMRRVHDAERDRKAYAEAMGSTARPHRLRASDGAPQRGMSNAGARPRFLSRCFAAEKPGIHRAMGRLGVRVQSRGLRRQLTEPAEAGRLAPTAYSKHRSMH